MTAAVTERPRAQGSPEPRRAPAASRHVLVALVDLQRQFPAWVIWLDGKDEWTATRALRPRESPSAGSHLLWVYAHNAEELRARTRELDR